MHARRDRIKRPGHCERYAAFSAEYAADIAKGNNDDLNDPDEIRSEANRIKHVGDTFSVETAAACEAVREYAREQEIEQEMNRDWDDNDRRGGDRDDQCSDGELDSRFSTSDG